MTIRNLGGSTVLVDAFLANRAFQVAMLLYREVSRSKADWTAIRATLALWQRCCVSERHNIVRMFWDLAAQAADEGEFVSSGNLSMCAQMLAVASTYPLDAYVPSR